MVAAGALLLCGMILSPLFSQEVDERSGLRVTIRMDRFAFTDDEPLRLTMSVQNTLYRNDYFRIYDINYTTFQPVVYTSEGREAETIVNHRLMGKDVKDVVRDIPPRTIHLGPGESISRTIDLKQLYKLEAGKQYRVKVLFFPDAAQDAVVASDNSLSFKVSRPAIYGPGPAGEEKSIRSGIAHQRFTISPREIVMLFLTAEKERDWDTHLKYVKLENYIGSFQNFARMYNSADDAERLNVLENFVTFIKKDRPDYILGFEVKGQSIVSDRVAYVNANVDRYNPRFRMKFQYKYTLEKFRDIWLVTEVEAIVRKGK